MRILIFSCNSEELLLARRLNFLIPYLWADELPQEADAVIFPQFLGQAYHMVDDF